MTYAEKLKDPRWQKVRLEIFQRDDFTCRMCDSKTHTLAVHHGFYARGRCPWEYPESSLITLCETCHSQVEAMRERLLSLAIDPHVMARLIVFAEELTGRAGEKIQKVAERVTDKPLAPGEEPISEEELKEFFADFDQYFKS